MMELLRIEAPLTPETARALRAGQRQAGFFFEQVRALVARGRFFLLVKRLALRAGSPAAWGRFFLSVKWLCAPRGPEVGRGVSNPPSLPLDSTLPATS